MWCNNFKEEFLLCVTTIVDLAETAAGYLSSFFYWFAVADVALATAVAATTMDAAS